MKVGSTRSGKPVILVLYEERTAYEVIDSRSFDHNDNFDVFAMLQHLAVRDLRRHGELSYEYEFFKNTLKNWEDTIPEPIFEEIKLQLKLATSIDITKFGRNLCEVNFHT